MRNNKMSYSWQLVIKGWSTFVGMSSCSNDWSYYIWAIFSGLFAIFSHRGQRIHYLPIVVCHCFYFFICYRLSSFSNIRWHQIMNHVSQYQPKIRWNKHKDYLNIGIDYTFILFIVIYTNRVILIKKLFLFM